MNAKSCFGVNTAPNGFPRIGATLPEPSVSRRRAPCRTATITAAMSNNAIPVAPTPTGATPLVDVFISYRPKGDARRRRLEWPQCGELRTDD
jgi:hypothetical protein